MAAIQHYPMTYGGHQEAYELSSAQAIREEVEWLKSELAKPDRNCKELFFQLIAQFGEKRRQIAIEAKTKDAHDFGRRRDADLEPYFTYLDRQYVDHGDRIKTLFVKYLPQLDKNESVSIDRDGFQIHFRSLDIPRFDGIVQPGQTMEVAKIDPDHPDLVSAASYGDHYEIGPAFCTIPPSVARLVSAAAIWDPKGQNITVAQYFHPYDKRVPIEKSIELLKSKPIYLTTELGSTTLENKPCVLIRHMDNRLVQSGLELIADIFARLVTRENPTADELKTDLAKIRYRFAYVMPYARGSGSVGEWLEKTIAETLGYTIMASQDMVDVKALTTLFFPIFQKEYTQVLQLTPSCREDARQ